MTKKRIKNIISWIIMIVAIITLIVVYSKYNYNDFVKSIQEKGKTNFTRDNEIKISIVENICPSANIVSVDEVELSKVSSLSTLT